MNGTSQQPCLVILDGNILSAIGLKGMIESISPAITVHVFQTLEALEAARLSLVVHYFVTADWLFKHNSYFAAMAAKVIVLSQGHVASLPEKGYRVLDVTVPEPAFLRDLLNVHGQGHGVGHAHCKPPTTASSLSRRENEVLRAAVLGLQNKEMADSFHISLSTVIFHRKNIAQKLTTKSLSSWTIYAVVNGLVRVEEVA